MIAEHSLLLGREAGLCRLVLDRKHESLLNGGDTARLQQALSAQFGENIRLEVEVGQPAQETPAQRKERLASERRVVARRRLEGDPVVRSLIAAFDGRLESVRPL